MITKSKLAAEVEKVADNMAGYVAMNVIDAEVENRLMQWAVTLRRALTASEQEN